MFEKDWTTSSINMDTYSILNTELNWEDPCIQWRNQQTRTYDNRNWIRGGPIFIYDSCQYVTVDLQMQQLQSNL